VAWFFDLLLINENAAGEDDGLGALTSGSESTVDEQLVQPQFHRLVPFL
jgi:hypothetical protein